MKFVTIAYALTLFCLPTTTLLAQESADPLTTTLTPEMVPAPTFELTELPLEAYEAPTTYPETDYTLEAVLADISTAVDHLLGELTCDYINSVPECTETEETAGSCYTTERDACVSMANASHLVCLVTGSSTCTQELNSALDVCDATYEIMTELKNYCDTMEDPYLGVYPFETLEEEEFTIDDIGYPMH